MKRTMLVVFAIVLLTAVPAQAGKGGTMGNNQATLVPNPASSSVGESVTFGGSGFRAETQYFLFIENAAGERVYGAGTYADADGNLVEDATFVSEAAGEYSVEAFELKSGLVLARHSSASATFTVGP